jgi:hypothetical protein
MVAVAINDALIAFKHLRQCIDKSFSHDTQIFPDARNRDAGEIAANLLRSSRIDGDGPILAGHRQSTDRDARAIP